MSWKYNGMEAKKGVENWWSEALEDSSKGGYIASRKVDGPLNMCFLPNLSKQWGVHMNKTHNLCQSNKYTLKMYY